MKTPEPKHAEPKKQESKKPEKTAPTKAGRSGGMGGSTPPKAPAKPGDRPKK